LPACPNDYYSLGNYFREKHGKMTPLQVEVLVKKEKIILKKLA
jgi:hypothetical protein